MSKKSLETTVHVLVHFPGILSPLRNHTLLRRDQIRDSIQVTPCHLQLVLHILQIPAFPRTHAKQGMLHKCNSLEALGVQLYFLGLTNISPNNRLSFHPISLHPASVRL